MNILHVESSPGYGGQEMRILCEAIGMREKGHRVIIAAEKSGGLIKPAKEAGVKIYEIKFKKAFWPFSFFYLLYIVLVNKIDIINTHSSSDSWLGGIVARCKNIPIIRTRHLSTKIKAGLNSRLLYNKLADFVVTTSSAIIPKISEQSGISLQKCKCIPTGVDLLKCIATEKQKQDFRNSLKITKDHFLVGMVCFMRSWKGIHDFIQAADLLRNDPSIKFVIIGGGHEKEYREKVKELKLEKSFFFTSHLANPYPAIASLDVFSLLSTDHEGVSQASLQAAYFEKPLITTPIGGLPEVCVHGETGLIVPPFSPNKVAEAIMQLKENDEQYNKMAKAAKKRVENYFTKEKMLQNMEEVYLEIVR